MCLREILVWENRILMRFIFMSITLGVDGQNEFVHGGCGTYRGLGSGREGAQVSISFQVFLLNEMPSEGFLPGEYPAL